MFEKFERLKMSDLVTASRGTNQKETIMKDNQSAPVDAVVMPRQQVAALKRAGYLLGESAGSTCADCDKNCGRGWWQKVSFEYDEWECWCRECAYARLHQYDDLDVDAAMQALESA